MFDKGYCHYGWWTSIDQAKALFVTRPKTNMGLEWLAEYQGPHPRGDGFVIVEDSWVHLSSKGHSKLPIPLRRIRLKRDNGQVITLITNDLIRSAVGIAALYKARWQIELLFRWIKQNLRITRFLGYNDNAIRLQLYAAMVAYALVRIAAATYRVSIPILRFIELIGRHLFERRQMAAIQKPPTVNPNKKKLKIDFNQYDFQYV